MTSVHPVCLICMRESFLIKDPFQGFICPRDYKGLTYGPSVGFTLLLSFGPVLVDGGTHQASSMFSNSEIGPVDTPKVEGDSMYRS